MIHFGRVYQASGCKTLLEILSYILSMIEGYDEEREFIKKIFYHILMESYIRSSLAFKNHDK